MATQLKSAPETAAGEIPYRMFGSTDARVSIIGLGGSALGSVRLTGHKDPAIHLRVLAQGYIFDSCQLPLNVFDANYHSFEQYVLPELNRRGIAAIGMKSLCGTGDPVTKKIVTAAESLRYVMSLPITTLVSGIDSMDVLHQNLAVVRNFEPMTPDEMLALRERCAQYSADGHFELYKSSKTFDGDVGREQHGFPPEK